ncbi:MAG: forkhead-associated protein [Comamonadaceae bacterium]|nr:MAG: forkhead-associated protein [Comamonadaceae bacterium]
MISCLLKQVTRNRKGLASSKDISVTGETMDIGRAPVCKIHLLDHQAFLHHATITRADDGTLQIAGVGEAEISIDGTPRHMATLQPGMQIGIGAYQLRVEPSSDPYDLILQLEWVQANWGMGWHW